MHEKIVFKASKFFQRDEWVSRSSFCYHVLVAEKCLELWLAFLTLSEKAHLDITKDSASLTVLTALTVSLKTLNWTGLPVNRISRKKQRITIIKTPGRSLA